MSCQHSWWAIQTKNAYMRGGQGLLKKEVQWPHKNRISALKEREEKISYQIQNRFEVVGTERVGAWWNAYVPTQKAAKGGNLDNIPIRTVWGCWTFDGEWQSVCILCEFISLLVSRNTHMRGDPSDCNGLQRRLIHWCTFWRFRRGCPAGKVLQCAEQSTGSQWKQQSAGWWEESGKN